MKKPLGIIAALIAALALCGCTAADGSAPDWSFFGSEQPEPTERAPVTEVDDPDVFETTVKISDGREVTCLKYAGSQRGGLSCDWASATTGEGDKK